MVNELKIVKNKAVAEKIKMMNINYLHQKVAGGPKRSMNKYGTRNKPNMRYGIPRCMEDIPVIISTK